MKKSVTVIKSYSCLPKLYFHNVYGDMIRIKYKDFKLYLGRKKRVFEISPIFFAM